MEKKTIILIVIAVLVIALAALGLYIANGNGGNNNPLNIDTSNILNTGDNADVNETEVVENITNEVINETFNETVNGDDSLMENLTNDTNSTYKVYDPQSDSYVPVIGEEFDEEVNRWYTYDTDGVRYYNTRINH